ncbi:MAG: zinc ribbon domain-containing protein [Candidatus Eremiobacterota bacterium]
MDDYIIPLLIVGIVAAGLGIFFYNRFVSFQWMEFAKMTNLYYMLGNDKEVVKVWGKFRELKLALHRIKIGHKSRDTHFTEMYLEFPSPSGLGITIYRQDWHNRFGDFFGGSYIQTGDSDFDENFIIRSIAPVNIGEVIPPEYRREFLKSKHLIDIFIIDTYMIKWKVRWPVLKISTMTYMSDFLYRMVQHISRNKEKIENTSEKQFLLSGPREEEKICQSCGKAVPEGSQFCINCGNEAF